MIMLLVNLLIIIIFDTSYTSASENNTNQQTNTMPTPIYSKISSFLQDNQPVNQKKYDLATDADKYLAWLEKNPPTQLSRKQRESILAMAKDYQIPLNEAYDIFIAMLVGAHKASSIKRSKKAADKKKHNTYANKRSKKTQSHKKTIKKKK